MKYNEELLSHFKAKHLGYMTADSQKNVEVTDRGFVYKGELIVAISGLLNMIVEKETVTVGDLEAKGAKKSDPVAKLAVEVTKLVEDEDDVEDVKRPQKQNDPRVVKAAAPVEKTEEPKAEEPKPVAPAPKRRGPKPKNKSA